LKESDKLPEPIFTPATKATTGHDINISFEEMCKLVDPELSRQLRDLTLRIYKKGRGLRAAARHHHRRHQV
jgi:phosphoribosylaminoimidazole-succinocarboxamide synthase